MALPPESLVNTGAQARPRPSTPTAVNAETHGLACLRHARLMGAGYLQRRTSDGRRGR
jgi:hypothetical protein